MKADHRKHLEQNELASRLARWWKGTGEARSSSTTWAILAAAVLIAVLVFAWRYYSDSTSRTRAAVWKQIEEATKADDLQAIVDAHRGTSVGRAAKAQLARLLLTEGLNQLGNRFNRSKAIANVDRARTLYQELATEAKDDVLLQREAMLAAAKAEESLVGIAKPDNAGEYFGSLDKALQLYDEAAQKFPDTPQGKEAAERAKDIRENRAKIEAFYVNLNKRLDQQQKTPPEPAPPPLDFNKISPLAPPPSPEPIVGPTKPVGTEPPLAPPPNEPKPKEAKPADSKPPLAPPPDKKDTKPTEAKPVDAKPASPLQPPKDPAQPPPKTDSKPDKQPDKPEKK